MTPREALKTLINTVDFLTPKDRGKLIDSLETLSDEEVQSMGVFFSAYLKDEAQNLQKQQLALEEVMKVMST